MFRLQDWNLWNLVHVQHIFLWSIPCACVRVRVRFSWGIRIPVVFVTPTWTHCHSCSVTLEYQVHVHKIFEISFVLEPSLFKAVFGESIPYPQILVRNTPRGWRGCVELNWTELEDEQSFTCVLIHWAQHWSHVLCPKSDLLKSCSWPNLLTEFRKI